MVNAEWQRFREVSPDQLTDDDKDELYKVLGQYKLEDSLDKEDLRNLFCLTQEVLKQKGEQVDSLIAELDEVAALQGEQEVQHQQEIQELRFQLSRARQHSSKSPIDSTDGRIEDEYNVELEQAETRIQLLQSELQSRDQEMESNKQELEKFAGIVAGLERERDDLKRELIALREETRDQHDYPPKESPPSHEFREKVRHAMETLRNKNKHISQLLNDIETVEKENVLLREKMFIMKSELSEATEHITQITGQLTNLQISIKESQDRNDFLESQSQALRNQVEELVEQQQQRDAQIDDFSEALDARVQELKRVIEEKNGEIRELREKLTLFAYLPKASSDSEDKRVASLSQVLESREKQIEELQNQLSQLKQDLQESSTVIETLRSNITRLSAPTDTSALEKKLRHAEQRIQMLEEKLVDAEQDAQAKAQELTELVVQLRRYECGEFGLAEAVAEIKQLRQQRRIRDRHIEELIQVNNQLEAACSTLEEQNIALRDRLGMPADEPVNLEGIGAKRRKEQMLLRVQQQRTDLLEEDLIQLKLEKRAAAQRVRALTKQLQSLGVDPEPNLNGEDQHDSTTPQNEVEPVSKDVTEPQEVETGTPIPVVDFNKLRQLWEAERKATVEENEALRQGLHEILESIRHQDGASNVQVKSDILERLLEALDSRHISGWYHPAMRLQAQLNHIEGRCAILREELRASRQSKAESSEALHECKLQLAVLTRELSVFRDNGTPPRNLHLEIQREEEKEEPVSPKKARTSPPPQSQVVRPTTEQQRPVLSFTEDMPADAKEMITQLNSHLLVVINEYNVEQGKIAALHSLYKDVCHQFVSQSKELDQVRTIKDREIDELQEKLHVSQEKLTAAESRLEVLDKSIEDIMRGDDATAKSALQSAQKLAEACEERNLFRLKVEESNQQTVQCRKQMAELRQQLSSARTESAQRLGDLLRGKMDLLYRLSDMERDLANSVNLDHYYEQQRQLNEMVIKWRNLLQHQCPEIKEVSEKENRLIAELDLEKSRREELNRQLRDMKEKFNMAQMQNQYEAPQPDTTNTQMESLIRKLAAAEASLESERNRVTHVESIAALSKEELNQTQLRCHQLERDMTNVLSQNQQLQLQEASLRDTVALLPSLEEVRDLQKKLAASQAQVADLQLCRRQLQELIELSHQQVKELEQFREGSELELDSLRATVLELQTCSDQAETIANLMEESSRTKREELSAKRLLVSFQMELGRLQALQLRQEALMEEMRESHSKELKQMTKHARGLQSQISELRVRYMGATPLSALELLHSALERRSAEIERLKKELKRATEQLEALTIEHEQVSVRREMSLELKNALEAVQGDNDYRQTLDNWAAKNVQLRLQEARSRRQCDLLEMRAVQAERRLEEQEELLAQLEEKLVRAELRHIAHLSVQALKSVDEIDVVVEKDNLIKASHPKEVQKQTLGVDDLREKSDDKIKSLEVTIESLQQKIRQYETDSKKMTDDMKNLTERLALKEQSLASCEVTVCELRKYEQISRNLELKCDQLQREAEQRKAEDIAKQQYGSDDLELKKKLQQLEQTLEERERSLSDLRSENLKLLQLQSDNQRIPKAASVDLVETSNTAALKATVDSLQNILNQKEETIRRYQSLLRDAREEESRAVAALQEQLCSLQSDLAVQEQAYNRLKNTVRQQAVSAGGVSSLRAVLEAQTVRIHELEDEIASSRTTIASLNGQLQSSREEAARWSNTAQQRLAAMDELSQRLAKQHRVELEQCQAQQALLSASSISSLLTNKMKTAITEPGDLSTAKSSTDDTNRNRILRQMRTEIDSLKHSLHLAEEREAMAKKDAQRLRDQLPIYSRRTQSNRNLSTREESLIRKISELESQLEEQRLSYEKAEEDFKDKEIQKIKSAEQIARWDERKKFEAKIEKLKAQLQDRMTEIAAIQSKLEKTRESLQRAEKEKMALQQQMKDNKGSEVAQLLVEELQRDRERLQAEVAALQEQCPVRDNPEQERHIQGLKNELERIVQKNEELLKSNLTLECDNLELRMELERFHASQPILQRRLLSLEKCAENLKMRSPRKHVVTSCGEPGVVPHLLPGSAELAEIQNLRQIVCELQEENQRLLAGDGEHIENLHGEVCRLRKEKMAAQQRCEDLANELDRAQCHIKKLECGTRNTGEGESYALRAELDHKTQLLTRVKVLLERAAEKERALREQVGRLQKLVPPEAAAM